MSDVDQFKAENDRKGTPIRPTLPRLTASCIPSRPFPSLTNPGHIL
jgi:hypothetical protein